MYLGDWRLGGGSVKIFVMEIQRNVNISSCNKLYDAGTFRKGIVFNIKRFSIHDGPGIRTTVFMALPYLG
jgi:hypothetical protein